MEQIFYVGSYSKKGGYFPRISGEGLTKCALNVKTGELKKKESYQEVPNATYLTKYGSEILLVASDEYYNPGNVLSVALQKDTLVPLSSQSTHGAATCHLSVNDVVDMVFVVSYLDSRLSVHDMKEGKLSPAKYVYQYQGHGPNKERQEQSHAHCAQVSSDGKWLYVCDLGSDKIWIHDIENLTGEFTDVIGITVPSGYGPRHLVFGEKFTHVYVICELNAHVLTYNRNEETGMLTLIDDQATLPENYDGIPSAAAIRMHPSKNTLYISNRIHNSIAVFSINRFTGTLTFETRIDTEGNEPRDFDFDPSGEWLVCANQDSDTIVSIKLDANTGLPTSGVKSVLECGTPVCVLF
ncbi:lactonase family protein [Chitinophagaceae bacterium LB-8]|uniref:Lactonase family protein n=1 Tax=Paraflavisolibacter caeni TaxID=2982496 RepID=A0A9X2XXR7_9BACT|nr:lactonase family protein [Paraflavisolibacter caeni]MCU7551509.1 lactonase family protein [Paraflavisolibacter caeni]